ncbi:cysteine proteinase [Acephala macrosclerotiorum]|nr:cysteine proteinase [Acephala macrosclerotiorum]
MTPRRMKEDKPTYKPGVLSYGCGKLSQVLQPYHLRLSMTQSRINRFVKNYKNALVSITDNSPILVQHYKDKKDRTVARIGPLYLCTQCDLTFPEDRLEEHSKQEKHRIYVESRKGHVFCNMCKDFVFDPTLEALRTKKVETGSFAGSRKRKPDEHADLFQEATMKEHASKRACNTISVRGMWNMGSTCYMTVILESLVHNPLVRNFYLSEGHKPETCPRSQNDESCLSCNMDEMFQDFNNTDKKDPFRPHDILGSFILSSKAAYAALLPNEQQDAHEFLNFLLEELHEITSSDTQLLQMEASSVNHLRFDGDGCNCVIHQTFYGKTQSIIKCKGEVGGKKCGAITRSSPQQFSDLSLGLDFLGKAALPSLEKLLKKEYFTQEQCDYKCSQCGCKKATKQVSIKTLPNVLCIQLKRFSQRGDNAIKIKKKVSFPLKLEMLPYTDRSGEAKGYGKTQHALRTRSTYHLQSVIAHKGNAIEQGHYISYSKHDNQWFQFDDHKAFLASKSEVLGAEAYILFYVIQSLASADEQN